MYLSNCGILEMEVCGQRCILYVQRDDPKHVILRDDYQSPDCCQNYIRCGLMSNYVTQKECLSHTSNTSIAINPPTATGSGG